jgi:hypothetical protein
MSCSINQDLGFILPLSIAILSFLGSVFIIVVCITKNLMQVYTFKILIFIAINDIIRSILFSIPLQQIGKTSYCKVIAYLLNVFFLSTITWSACICTTIYKRIVKGQGDHEKHHKYWVILAYPVNILLESLPYSTNSFTFSDGSCSLQRDFAGNIWRFTLIYCPAWLILLFTLFIFTKVYKEVKKHQKNAGKSVIFDRGFIYPIIIAIIITPLTIARIVEIFSSSCSMSSFIFVSFCILNIHGILNAVVFVMNENVRTSFQIIQPAAQHSLNINGLIASSVLSDSFSLSDSLSSQEEV